MEGNNTSTTPTEFGQAVDKKYTECQELFWERNTKYGPKNISRNGTHGVIVRLQDKMERLQNFHSSCLFHHCLAEYHSEDESIEDTLRDIANYAIIGLLLHSGEWELNGS